MSLPYTARFATVMVLLMPTFLSANDAVVADVSSTTSSVPTTPLSTAFVVLISPSATALALYTRFTPMMPVTVSSFAVMFAVVLGCVST